MSFLLHPASQLSIDMFIEQFLAVRSKSLTDDLARTHAQQTLQTIERLAEESHTQHVDQYNAVQQSSREEEEVLQLLSLPSVQRVSTQGDDLIVRTHALIAQDVYAPYTRILIPPMDITISSLPVSWQENDLHTSIPIRIASVHGGQAHPHVFPGGSVCWGRAKPSIITLLQQKEFSMLVAMIVSFLETFNSTDTIGRYQFSFATA